MNRLKNAPKDASYSIDKCDKLLNERYETKRGKDVAKMLIQHVLCKDDYISRCICKEVFRDKKIIDSHLIWEGKASVNLIRKKLLSIREQENRQIYAKILAKELDAKLNVVFEIIIDLEKAGCKSLYIKRDLNDFLRDLTSVFSDFKIDIVNYLKEYKDFDPEYGCYEDYRDEAFVEKKNKENCELEFKDYLIHGNKEALITVLHNLIDGKECKDVTKVLIALEEASFLQRPSNAKLYRSLLKEFDLNFSDSPSAMNTFFREKDIKYSKEEIKVVVNSLLEVKL